jgi:transposase
LPRPKKNFSPEYREEAVKMVIETSRPIARVARELGINEGTLGNWVAAYRREHAGEEPPLALRPAVLGEEPGGPPKITRGTAAD